jgi:Ca2+-binding RTX toxin-like protein
LLYGGSGNDTLNGEAGSDRLEGGLGNDSYTVDSYGDYVAELADEGTDTVKTTLAAYDLGTYVENLSFTGAGNNIGRGNTFANVITGNAAVTAFTVITAMTPSMAAPAPTTSKVAVTTISTTSTAPAMRWWSTVMQLGAWTRFAPVWIMRWPAVSKN